MKNTPFINTKDYLVTQESFELWMDSNLEMLVTKPQPEEANLSKYYETDAYISHSDSSKGLMGTIYYWVKNYALKQKVKLISVLSKTKGSVLDIGCGTGSFLETASKNNWNVFGVEPNPKAAEIARNKNIKVSESIKAYEGQKFDVVTLWHVLEHIPNLKETISQLEALVKPGGKLVIAVPNYNSYDAKKYKQFWAAYDVPRHLWHFSRSSMNILFSNKFKLEITKPMYFDSVYVSLLSEKYKTGKSFSLKAICVGLYSNLLALKTKEYSSIIYCFKKSE